MFCLAMCSKSVVMPPVPLIVPNVCLCLLCRHIFSCRVRSVTCNLGTESCVGNLIFATDKYGVP